MILILALILILRLAMVLIDIVIEIVNYIDLCEFNKNLVPGFPAAERCLKELINVAKKRKYNLVSFDRYDDTNFYIYPVLNLNCEL